jgi:uncharacterized protein (TIGR02246 family)
MHQNPKSVVLEAFEAIDRLDPHAYIDMMAEDVSQVDEVTRRWLRGKTNVSAAIIPIFARVTSIKSALSDVHVSLANDMAIVTCVLDQIYDLDGQSTAIVAPTTCVLRRGNGDWKIVLFHSLPFSEA